MYFSIDIAYIAIAVIKLCHKGSVVKIISIKC
jgi:hypothetical protein